jgi:hypothetical protein
MKHDIVYFVKQQPFNEELRYSVRSVEKNFPYNKIWFYGGCPLGLKPDEHIFVKQDKPTKWENVKKMLYEVCRNDDITENFWLFNDDFFIMEKIDEPKNYYNGSLENRIKEIENRRKGHKSEYSVNLEITKQLLEEQGYPTLNYAVHIPMLINRKKALETLNKFPDSPMFRSLYGNYVKLPAVDMPDVKIHQPSVRPKDNAIMLSSSDRSFEIGYIGVVIKDKFRNKSKYEN